MGKLKVVTIRTTSVKEASEWLKKGFVVAIPTETVYGLAANALDEKAVTEVFRIKNRPFFDPLIVHIPDWKEIEKYAEITHETQLHLAQRFWPGPLTILFRKKDIIPELVTAGSEWVALRSPLHPLTLGLLRLLEFPLAAPSANPFGYISPTLPEHVEKQLGNQIPCILDGGPCAVGVESTVIRVIADEIHILRPGGITPEELAKTSGLKVNIISSSFAQHPLSPGQLLRHYSPLSPMRFCPRTQWTSFFSEKNVSCIFFGKPSAEWPSSWKIFSLSESENLEEAARNLFKILRMADEANTELILSEPVPDKGLGLAINDRLRRAAARSGEKGQFLF